MQVHLFFPITFVEILGHLAGVTTAIAATPFDRGALSILLTALYTSCRKAAGLLWRWAVALLHPLNGLQELAACKTLVVLLGEKGLKREERGGRRGKIYVRLVFKWLAANKQLFDLTVTVLFRFQLVSH